MHSAAATACGSTPPGFQLFTKGWDLSTIDLLNPNDMKMKTTVLATTCDAGTTYVNDYNHQTYMMPDQLAGQPVNVAGDVKQAFELLVDASQSFREQLAVTIGESAFFGLFSSSQTFYEAASLLMNESVYTGIQSSHMAAYEMNLLEPFVANLMNLTISCQYLVDRLPPTFNETTMPDYETMINTCGTHYMTQATFGCKFQYRHFTGMGKLDVMASGDVGLNAGLDFLSFLAASGAVSGTAAAASDNYLNITKNYTSCYGGGTVCPSDTASFEDWLKICPSEPAFISGKFGSIGDLIRQPDVSASFKLATQNHFNRAFLKDELIPLFNLLVKVVNGPIGSKDDGGTCSAPAQCPGLDPPPDFYCDGLTHFGETCPNPILGPTLVADWAQVQANITAWTTKIGSLITQAETALKTNVVPNSTITLIGVEFVYYVSNVQLPLVVEHCGWTFKQYWYDNRCNLCSGSATPADCKDYIERTVSYIKGLF